MSVDDRFRDVVWEEVLFKLTVRARQLFAAAKAKGYGNALARVFTDPDDLAGSVFLAALEYNTVKYKPAKGASLSTFLCRVLEDDFKDLLRKGKRLDKRLQTLDPTAVQDPELESDHGLVRGLDDDGEGARLIELRAAALHAANGDRALTDYVTAAFDCGAATRSDQAACLDVQPSDITNRRKRLLKLLSPDPTSRSKTPGGGK
jgi:DNA-directed RNA polymerase specialized sigma24 family protein